MRCPKCRSEIGTQPVCPYCGGTIYIQSSPTWTPDSYSHHTVAPNSAPGFERRGDMDLRGMEKRLRHMETKINLALIMQCGSFALLLLVLLVLALK